MFNQDFLIHFAGSALLFLVMWNVFGRGVMKPFFAIVEERETKTKGSEDLAHRKREELKKLESNLKHTLLEARLRGLSERDALVQKAKGEASGMRERAVQGAGRELARARQDAEQLKLKNLAEMEAEVEALAQLLMSQVAQKPTGRVLH